MTAPIPGMGKSGLVYTGIIPGIYHTGRYIPVYGAQNAHASAAIRPYIRQDALPGPMVNVAQLHGLAAPHSLPTAYLISNFVAFQHLVNEFAGVDRAEANDAAFGCGHWRSLVSHIDFALEA